MNYGHSAQNNQTLEFFTSGQGTNAENVNNFESENNLDLTNAEAQWNQPLPNRQNTPNHVAKALGNLAARSRYAEQPQQTNEYRPTPEPLQEQPPLGEVVEMPPATIRPPYPTTLQPEAAPAPLDPALTNMPVREIPQIKTAEKLSESGIVAVDNAIHKLNQDGDISSFYDVTRDMMEENLKNSYNRKLAA